MSASDRPSLLGVLEENWQAEMKGYSTYLTLSQSKAEPQRRNALRGLAAVERHHADLWAGRLRELGGPTLVYRDDEKGDAANLTSMLAGSAVKLRRLEIDESRDIARYYQQLVALGDARALEILDEVIADEKEHYRILGTLIASTPGGGKKPADAKMALADLLTSRDKGRHEASSWVGDAIYGINDGLGSIFGIVSGVAGATLGNSHFVLIAGLGN